MDEIVKETTKTFLNIFFNKGETICVSDCDGGYHSIEQELDKVTLISPTEGKDPRDIKEKDINLVAINPVNGWRRDRNVTAFRSFLIEMDEGDVTEQKKYIEELGMPYSMCIFSGNKSLHYGIVLGEDVVNEDMWKFVNQWILNIVSKADQQCINPTRSIRFPGNKRKNGKRLIQSVVDVKQRISQEELFNWLNNFPDKKPKKKVERKKSNKLKFAVSITGLAPWARKLLEDGILTDRNKTWFRVACNCRDSGMEYDNAIEILNGYFDEESDFPKSEWLNCISSAYRREV